MKKKIALLMLLTSCYAVALAVTYDSPAFKIQDGSSYEYILPLNQSTFSSDTSLILRLDNSISGFAISGKTTLLNEESIIRVLLLDAQKNEYLVFEDYRMFSNDKERVFMDEAIETILLENIIPTELKIIISDATLEILKLKIVPAKSEPIEILSNKRHEILSMQQSYMISLWNKLNSETNQYWVAGETSISGLPYAKKKLALGATNDHYLSDGLEYYVGGIFLVRCHSNCLNALANQSISNHNEERDIYVDHFDWRNRHGKSWMTSVKDQNNPSNNTGNGGCWIFGSVAALESRLNLYYNRFLNLDLSEQEVGACSPSGSMHTGGYPFQAYNYISQNGIANESCLPFLNSDTIPCENKCSNPEYVANISSYTNIISTESVLKHELINYGPIASGISTANIRHVMCLCGYWTIHEGDHIYYAPEGSASSAFIDTIIPNNSNLIGKTCWIYKNSSGFSEYNNGYIYAVYENDASMAYSTKLFYPVTLSTLTSDDIICSDEDNDGYYFWGLGQRPDNCPICCPNIPDGDDSNPLAAQMDEFGNFSPYVFPYPELIISNDTTISTNLILCGNLTVTNNATLIVGAELTMNPAAKIILQNGGKLVVDGGSVINANIDVHALSKLMLINNAKLYLTKFDSVTIQLGAEADLEYGEICKN